ncbi:heterokaryon incompatibility protein-domain-containing protein [Coniochaeta sp. 2T2.1]|nr:heterokaryon incompatibility protein-domain-containing protein [Coniochaeta sp. 2T2.1]
MIIINAHTLELETFMDESAMPPYAILSHTWGAEEVTMQEFQLCDQATRTKAGYLKIQKTCELAISTFGLNYAWVDTCCIDKKSSAELSEAINSMFRWYAQAKVCIVFLEDLDVDPFTPCLRENGYTPTTAFERCRWFSRGWCLQELIAPQHGALTFHDSSWRDIGSRHQLANYIRRRTGISQNLLEGDAELQDFSIAQRMSWAANRHTTRIEDRAYSLLGIFDVNMPLLYGEGPRAFLRLQDEISRDSQDLSIFAWRRWHNGEGPDDVLATGLFAASPDDFACAGDVVQSPRNLLHNDVTLNNKGVRFESVRLHRDINEDEHWVLMLDVFEVGAYSRNCLGFYLRQVAPDVFVRVRPAEWKRLGEEAASALHKFTNGTKDWLDWFEELAACKYTLYVPKTIAGDYEARLERMLQVAVRVIPRPGSCIRRFRVVEVYPGPLWMSVSRSFRTFASTDSLGYVELRLEKDEMQMEPLIIACGVYAGRCWCHASMRSDPITSDIKNWARMFNNNKLTSGGLTTRITPYKMHVIPFNAPNGRRSGYVVSVAVTVNLRALGGREGVDRWDVCFSLDKGECRTPFTKLR